VLADTVHLLRASVHAGMASSCAATALRGR
jgi:hypothetical protein